MNAVTIRRRYLSLGVGELAALAILIAYWYLPLHRFTDVRPVEVALLLLAVLLVQGGAYWLLARRWIPGGRMPARIRSSYRLLRVVNVVLIAGAAIWIVVLFPGASGVAQVSSVLLWLFALVEYVNYFWVRLSYPVSRWVAGLLAWRPSRLARDLAASQP